MLHKPFNPLLLLMTVSLSVILSSCDDGDDDENYYCADNSSGAGNDWDTPICNDWELPKPIQTGIDPVVSEDYSFSQSGCFSVYQYPNSGQKVVRFARDCERYDAFGIINGGFWMTWGDREGSHCPTDSYAISGSFVTATRAEGTIKYGFGCQIVSEAHFVAEIAVSSSNQWRVNVNNDSIVDIFYGNGVNSAQYAVLDLESSDFRLKREGAESEWGTSVILLPAVWEEEVSVQGSPLLLKTWQTVGTELMLSISGTLSSQTVHGKIRLSPPDKSALSALVTMEIADDVLLDNPQGTAFKPVMLSSRPLSKNLRQKPSSYIDSQAFPISSNEEMIVPSSVGKVFGVKAGTSNGKATIEVRLNQRMQITGRVISSSLSNEDNVRLWATTEKIIPAWQYMIIAKPTSK